MASKSFVIRGQAKVQNAIRGMDKVASSARKAGQAVEKASSKKGGMGGLGKLASEASGALGGMGGQIASVASRFGPYGAAIGAAIGATAALGVAMDRALNHAVKYDSVMASLPFSIDEAKEASLGMIDSFELAKVAVKAERLGVAATAEEFAQLTEAAKVLALSLGEDIPTAIDDIIKGIGRQSPLILDNLGIMVDASAAYRDYAEAQGKLVSELTEAEKKQAFNTAAIKAANEAAKNAKVEISELAKDWAHLKGSVADFWNDTKSVTAAGMDAVYRGVTSLDDAFYDSLVAMENWITGAEDVRATTRGMGFSFKEAGDQFRYLFDPEWWKKAGERMEEVANTIEITEEQSRQDAAAAEAEAQRYEARLAIAEAQAQRRIEQLTLQGADSFRLIEAQENARVHFIQERLRLTDDEIEKMQLRDDLEAARWSAQKARIEERRRRAQEEAAQLSELTKANQEAQLAAASLMGEARRQEAEDRFRMREWEIQRELELERSRLELMAEEGLDPHTQRQMNLEAERQALEERLALYQQDAEKKMEVERIKTDLQKNATAQRIAQLQQEKAAAEGYGKGQAGVAKAVIGVYSNLTGQITGHLRANQRAYGISEKAMRAMRAGEMATLGLTEAANAAADFANWPMGIPSGIAHTAASALAFTNAGIIASGAGQGGGGGPRPGGLSLGGGRGVSAPSAPRASSRSGTADIPEVPVSRPGSGALPPAPSASRSSGGSTYNITVNSKSLGRLDEDEMVLDLRHALQRSERNVGSL